MLNIILLSSVLWLPIQTDSSKFYVDSIEAETAYDSRYIFERASRIIPPEKLVGASEIDCLINDLMASGIFEDVKAEFTVTGPNTRKIRLACRYRTGVDRLLIREVSLNGFPFVDKAKFQAELHKRGIKAGTGLMKYYYRTLEDRINKAFRASLPKALASKFSGWTLITIRSSGQGQIMLMISPEYVGCVTPPA